MDRTVTIEELAEVLQVSSDTVRTWVTRYAWPHLRIGRTVRFTDEQVAEIERMHTVAPQQDPARRLQERWGLTERSARLAVGSQPAEGQFPKHWSARQRRMWRDNGGS